MKQKISRCTVLYESWQLQCCGDPIEVGKVANLQCIKDKRHKCYANASIDIDYNEEHHGGGTNFLLRGMVTRIQAIFVDRYADENNRRVDNPHNEFAIIETDYIDGFEDCPRYGYRSGSDVCDYIITLEDAVEGTYHHIPDGHHLYLEPEIEPDRIEGNRQAHFTEGFDSLVYYTEGKEHVIDLKTLGTNHTRLQIWQREYMQHIGSGYDTWDNNDWKDWWCRGYGLAKRIRKLMPSDSILYYGEAGQCREVIKRYGDKWELNGEGAMVTVESDMKEKEEAGLFIPKAYLNWEYEEMDAEQGGDCMAHKFMVSQETHHFFPGDSVMLNVLGRPKHQMGSVREVHDDHLLIHTDRWLDISEEYAIEVINGRMP